MAAEFPQNVGDIYIEDDTAYKVVKISGDTVTIVPIDGNGTPCGSEQPLKRRSWERRKFEKKSEAKSNPNVNQNNFNKYMFIYDDKDQKIVVVDPAGVEITRLDGLYGPTGRSFVTEWAERHHKDPNKPETFKEFEDFFKGKNGIGLDGNDGDTWEPHLLANGDLYFENTRTHEKTRSWNIKGPDGGPGKDGQTWRPVLTDNGQRLHFENDRGEKTSEYDVKGATGEGKEGPRGFSAYDIWVKEGHQGDYHDFLLWIAQQAQKGDDGKDGDTYIPHVKNGHLFFVSKKGGQIVDGGNVVGPQGPDGKPGLDGHNLRHEYDYQDLKDYVCPVQKMSPRLITSTTDLGSGDSARNHMKQTLHWIKNIRKVGEERHGSWIQEFFWWCAGADRALLRMCPAEHSKYMGIGTVIFFTALMAWFSSFTAMKLVFGETQSISAYGVISMVLGFILIALSIFSAYKIARKKLKNNQDGSQSTKKYYFWPILVGIIGIAALVYSFSCENIYSALFATFWAAMIFFLDRFITNTMYSDGKVTISWLELRSALPRILIAIFLGIIISAPLELTIFDKEISAEITFMKDNFVKERQQDINSQIAEKQHKIDTLNAQMRQVKNNISKNSNVATSTNEELNRYENEKKEIRKLYPDLPEPRVPDDEAHSKVWDTYRSRQTERKQKRDEAFAVAKAEHDANKQSLKDNYDQNVDTTVIHNEIVEIRKDITQLTNKANSLQSTAKEDFDKSNGLALQLKALHGLAFQERSEEGYKPWTAETEDCRFLWFTLGILIFLLLVSGPFCFKKVKDKDKNGSTHSAWKQRGPIVWPCLAVIAVICGYCNNALFNALPYYLFSAVGLIMMLFIIIDVSPVFYKMMLADGQYEQYLHKEKSVTQDLIRLNFAASISKVNQSEVARLAPMIFSKPWEKIKDIFANKETDIKPELSYGEDELKTKIEAKNMEIFENVLGMKKALIEAAYQAWYRDMKDCKIGHTDEAYRPDPKDPNPYTPEDYISNHDSMAGSRTSNESESEDGDDMADNHETDNSDVDAEFTPTDNTDKEETSDDNSKNEHSSNDIDGGNTVEDDTHETEKSGVNNSTEESTSREDNDDEYEKEQPE